MPSPSVVWFANTRLLDSEMESLIHTTSPTSPSTSPSPSPFSTSAAPPPAILTGGGGGEEGGSEYGGRPYNTLVLGPLTRHHLKMLLTCEAANNNITLPTSVVVMVDMNCERWCMVVMVVVVMVDMNCERWCMVVMVDMNCERWCMVVMGVVVMVVVVMVVIVIMIIFIDKRDTLQVLANDKQRSPK